MSFLNIRTTNYLNVWRGYNLKMIKKVLYENKLLMMLALVLMFCGITVFWIKTLNQYTDYVNSYTVRKHMIQDNDEDSNTRARSIQYKDDGAYLVNNSGEIICGPYKLIEAGDISAYSDVCRFIDDNGLIGYLSTTDGEIVAFPQYIMASEMQDGTACVSEGDGIYYISRNGERITENYYKNGYSFAESQGTYARVQFQDESWAIINREEEILLGDCEKINELPYVTTLGSAIKNGCALLYEFTHDSDRELQIIKVFEEYCEISEVHMGEFAIVKNRDGYYGVVCGWNGDVIVPATYISLDYEILPDEEDIYEDKILFKMQNADGTYETLIW